MNAHMDLMLLALGELKTLTESDDDLATIDDIRRHLMEAKESLEELRGER